MATSLRLIPLVVLILATLGADKVQAEAVCSNTPASGDRVYCEELQASTDNINIDLDGVTIDTVVANERSVQGVHHGTGKITINVQNSSSTTEANLANSIYGWVPGTGDIDIDVQNFTSTTKGVESNGILGWHTNMGMSDIDIDVQGSTFTTEGRESNGILGRLTHGGNIDINVWGGTSVTTKGEGSSAVVVWHDWHEESSTEQDNIDLDVQGSTITTEGASSHGLYGLHQGMGDINISARSGTSITTKGNGAHGIVGYQWLGMGNVYFDVQGSTLTTKGVSSRGIYGRVNSGGEGDIDIDVRNSFITTESSSTNEVGDTLAHGIYGYHKGTGNIDIDVQDGTIMTRGVISYGIYARHEGDGNLMVDTSNGNVITTTGEHAHGIVAYNYGTLDTMDTKSIIAIDVGGDIHASGTGAQGVRVGTLNTDPADTVPDGTPERVPGVDAEGYRRQTVTVNGAVTSAAEGVYLAGGGRVIIGPRGSIASESGIAILATGEVPEDATDPNNVIPAIKPKLRVDLNLGGRRVEQALGDDWIINDGGETTIAVNRTVLHDGAGGVTGRTAANGAWNVRMLEHGVKLDDYTNSDPSMWTRTQSTVDDPIIADRDFSANDFTETRRPRPPPPVPPVPVLQVYMVEEPIIGGADDVAGIHVEGDGIVHIGPMGSIRAESGIAILATQDPSGPLSNSSPEGLLFGDVIGGGVDLRSTGAVSEIATLTTGDGPKLTVDMDLDGRRVQDVIGDDWIINDQGETTIIVNGVTLHEGATGIVTDAVAPNGPFNVAMIGEGVMVTDRTDPANWIISDPTLGVIADRDFSAEDFIYLSTPGSPMFMEEYAPRAALYEVLPDFMLRMQKWEPTRQRLFLPESPVYIRLLGSTGSQEFKRSTVNANYDADRFAVEAGVKIPLIENLDIWASMHHVTGSADVSSPVNGGDIRVTGTGLSVDAYWSSENDYYATGRLSLTDYDIDLSSNTIGRLKSNGDANGQSVHVEAGRRMTLNENLHWTPRAWLGHTRISVDKFTDAVDSRVSFSNTDRFTGGLGVMAESVRTEYGGELLLRGSLDFEQKFGDSETVTLVSGERLSAEPEKSSALLSLSGTWKKGPFKFSAELSARQDFNSGGEDYSGVINVGMHF